MKPVDLRRVNDGQAWNGSIHGNRKPPGLPDNECGQAYSLLWLVKSLDCEIEGEYSVGRIQRVGFRLHSPRISLCLELPTCLSPHHKNLGESTYFFVALLRYTDVPAVTLRDVKCKSIRPHNGAYPYVAIAKQHALEIGWPRFGPDHGV